MIMHLQMFSGGACSWMSAKRMVAKHGSENCALLFADVGMEDEDLYRFLGESAANVFGWSNVPIDGLREVAWKTGEATIKQDGRPGSLTIVSRGVTPWQHFFDRRMMGNSRTPICTVELKRQLLDAWQKENCDPNDTTLYYGIDWTEEHRCDPLRRMREPFRVEFPMCEPPYLSKAQMLDVMKSEGICPPRLYGQGFPHNNCGGFCVKAGQAHFAHLLRVNPDRFAYHEAKEQEFIRMIGKDVSIMKDRTSGTTKTLTLKQLRERIETQKAFDLYDWGGCGCAVE